MVIVGTLDRWPATSLTRHSAHPEGASHSSGRNESKEVRDPQPELDHRRPVGLVLRHDPSS